MLHPQPGISLFSFLTSTFTVDSTVVVSNHLPTAFLALRVATAASNECSGNKLYYPSFRYERWMQDSVLITRGIWIGFVMCYCVSYITVNGKCIGHLTVWNLWSVIWFHFVIFSLILLPTPVALSVLSFFCLLVHFFWFFPEFFFLKIFRLEIDFFYMALVSLLGDNSWSVVCATFCHMAWVFAIEAVCDFFVVVVVSVH